MSPSRSGPRDQAEKMFAVLGDPRPLRGEGVVPHASIPEGLTAMEFVDGLLGQVESGELDGRELLMRVPADVVDQLGRPIVDPTAQAKPVATGIAASSGAGQGKIALSAEKATEYEKAGEPYVLIVNEVHHEEVESTRKSQGLISVRGGKTSHAAMIAANSDVPCVMNDKVTFNLEKRTVTIGRTTFKEGDALTIDGTKGNVYAGLVPLKSAAETDTLDRLLALADQHRRFHVLANADTPDEAVRAFKAGAEGIGLVRTENMFFEGGRVNVLREAVIGDPPRAAAAVAQLEKFQQHDFKALLEAANGKKVGIRLLDPPLFDPDDAKSVLPNDPKAIRDLAAHMGLQPDEVARRINGYQEVDPLIGLRGARLARLRPDLEAMQVRALAQAWVELNAEGKPPAPLNLMVPMIMNGAEMEAAAARIKATVKEVSDAAGVEVPLKLGSMIETPSAALDAGEIAKHVEWFSYGTNDLTQLTLGYGRNVAAKFIPELIAAGALDSDPGGTIDPGGVARLIKVAEFLGRDTVGELETGVCGAQGADPASIRTLESLGLDYVSVPPSQVARARVAAAQAAIARADAVADEPGEAPAASLGAAIDAAMAPITSFPVALDQRWLVDQLALSVRQAGAFLRSEASLSGDAAMVASQQPLVEKLLAAQHLLDTAHLANAMNAELNKLRRSGGQGSSFQTAAVALKAFCETATQGLGDETSTGREREVAQHAWDTLRAFEELRGELEKTSLPSDYDQQNRLRHKNDGWDNNHYTRQGPKQGESMAAYLRRISQEFLDDNGLQVKLLGAEKIPQGKKVIFAVTHRSGAIDRFVSNTALPLEEGKFMYMVRGDSPLDRIGQASGDPQNPVIAAGSFDETLAKVKAGFENGATTLVTYPEGTGTVSGEVRHVARSTAAFAEATGAVIVPVSIDDSFTAEPFQPGRIAVYVGNPIDPAEAKKLAGKEGGKGAVKLMQTNLHYQLAQGYHAGL
ncbi:MAG: hypothetical protein IPJ65_40510 [Archangiaceae bacterium]|nr:hypothetical protein [Archangiaceae bacterium]